VRALKQLLLLVPVVLGGVGAAHQDVAGGVVVHAVRFYQPNGGLTQVKAFIDIPATLLQPASAASAGQMTYLVDVRVRDSTGLELVRNSWPGHLSAGISRSGAIAVEILDFALAPGRYTIHVAVTDSASGQTVNSEVPVEGFRTEPEVSDLLLAPKIRQAGPADTLMAPGEIRRGDLLITGVAELHLSPLRSTAFYVLEAYSENPDSARLSVTVSDAQGKSVVSTPSNLERLPKGGGVLTGAVDLAGLPAGSYRLTAALQVGGRSITRSAPFEMADLAASVARSDSLRGSDRVTDSGYFGGMTSAQLDRAAAPLILIAKSGEMSVYSKDLSLTAKRNFLTRFWNARDRSPGTPRNEVREQFYAGIEYADSTFRERGRIRQPGWKTDRGKIYVRYGDPDEVLRRQQQGYAPPYEVWRYSRGKGSYYIFADRSGVGGYKLMSTNDVQEVGDPNWQRILGLPALEDIANFLNLDRIELAPGQ
jgi:GWxTD domain-containing protein